MSTKHSIVLYGEKNIVTQELQKQQIEPNFFELINAPEMIGMGEHPTKAVTTKPDSAIALGYKHLKAKEINAFCSAGNTGAIHIGQCLL